MPTESPQDETDWTSIYQRLQAGEYEVAARLLLDMQIASLNVGDSTSAGAAAAARQLCLALVSYRAEIEWHQLAQGNAELRQRAVSQNVLSLLSLVRGDPIGQFRGSMADKAADMSVKEQNPDHINIWQRIQHLLERERPTGSSARESSPIDEETDDQEGTSHVSSSDEPNSVEFVEKSPPMAEELPETSDAAKIGDIAPLESEDESGLTSTPPEKIPIPEPSPTPNEKETAPSATSQRPDGTETATANRETIPDSPGDLLLPDEEPLDLAIYCLGAFRILQHGRAIEHWNGLKGLSIIKYLAAHRNIPISKDTLMDVFWPDADLEAARRNLHQAIYSLRQTLRRENPDVQHIRFENNQYLLNPGLRIWVDVEEFEHHVRRGRALESAGQMVEALAEYGIADSLYQGAFLDEDVYEDWPRSRREYLRAAYMEIADRVSKHYVQQGAYVAAIGLCQKLLSQDHCDENAHRRLMRCYLAQGQRNLAIRQYQTCVQMLREDLDVPPSEETVALYVELTSRR